MTGSCVRSGYCCKVRPCPFGEWDAERHQCVYLELEHEDPPRYKCGIYDSIVGQPGAEVSPAFGAGCSSTLFNDDRDRILLWMRGFPTVSKSQARRLSRQVDT